MPKIVSVDRPIFGGESIAHLVLYTGCRRLRPWIGLSLA